MYGVNITQKIHTLRLQQPVSDTVFTVNKILIVQINSSNMQIR